MANFKKYWNAVYCTESLDLECDKKSHVKNIVDAMWSHDWDNGDLKTGDIFTDECELVQFYYNYAGVKIEVRREIYHLEYEHYHGDIAEHGTYY